MFNGATVLQALMSWSTINTGSQTEVRYKWIRKNTQEYNIVQQAIDTHILDNKPRFIPLKREFNNDSLRRFSSLYFGIKLDLYGSGKIDQQTQDIVMRKLQEAAKQKQLTITTKIKNDILNNINTTTINGQISTGKNNTEQLLKELNDPYSIHLTGDQNRIFQQVLDGSISGIGISVTKNKEPYVTIVEVINDTPAMKAWLLANDRIVRIEGASVTDTDSLSELIVKIQGPVGTSVTMTIQRWDTTFTKTITRATISIDPITIKEIDKDTVLMSISIFQIDIYKTFIKKISELKNYKTLIIDLRNNGGWSLEDAREMLNHIVPQGKAIYYMVTNEGETPTLSQGIEQNASRENKKIIFLTNKYTASASEIFAGVTREYDSNSLIIWEQTFGKWSVQTVRTYQDGSTLKLTTAHRLLGKSKKSIQGTGLTPDYVIIDDPLTIKDEVLEYVINNI